MDKVSKYLREDNQNMGNGGLKARKTLLKKPGSTSAVINEIKIDNFYLLKTA